MPACVVPSVSVLTAAVYSDAQHIEEGVYGLKTRAHDLAQADAAECAA